MAVSGEQRAARRHGVAADDQRSPFERDRDRILYSSAFRRLAGITQIVRAGEADVFHTRQQHSFKVAQVGRRIAQMLVANQTELAGEYGLDPEVVEAACLAHDLGHPPFGHVGEHVLNELVEQHDKNGFEGNAQSFRVLVRLAVRFPKTDGLDLTRATLCATLKYPWLRDVDTDGRKNKWGAYDLDEEEFVFAREGSVIDDVKSLEAELMDWSDDVAYSVHDLEDFHRCGAVPWQRILLDEDRVEDLIERAKDSWFAAPSDVEARLRNAHRSIKTLLTGSFGELVTEPYEGRRSQRQQLRTVTSQLIARYMKAIKIAEPGGKSSVEIGQDEVAEVRILKQITRDYIINNPALAAQQKGQERIIRHLFENLYDDSKNGMPKYLPPRLRYLWKTEEDHRARFVADAISSLTEAEASGLHARMLGRTSGSVLDPIVR